MYTGTLEPFSNRANWIISGSLVDEDTGEDVTLTNADMFFYLTTRDCPETAVLSATDGDGITYPTTTSFEIAFSADDVSDLCPGTYRAFWRMTLSGVTTQLFDCTVECKQGGPEA